jgi:hypothetical protein
MLTKKLSLYGGPLINQQKLVKSISKNRFLYIATCFGKLTNTKPIW